MNYLDYAIFLQKTLIFTIYRLGKDIQDETRVDHWGWFSTIIFVSYDLELSMKTIIFGHH